MGGEGLIDMFVGEDLERAYWWRKTRLFRWNGVAADLTSVFFSPSFVGERKEAAALEEDD